MPADLPQENVKSSIRWVILLWSSLFFLALFWSVDSAFVYFFLAISTFSFFKIIQSRKSEASSLSEEYEDDPYRASTTQNFWKNLKVEFPNQTSQSQVKVIALVVSGFIGFLIFILVVGLLLNLSSSEVSSMEYQQRASDFYMNQQYDSSVYYYGLALQADPENPDLWLERGNSFLYVPNADSSLAMYQRALELDPTFEQAQYNIGYIYFDRKNYRDAIEETRKILAYNPDYTEAKLLIGDSFYNRSQLDSALQWYESAYQSGYRSAILCHLMAYIYDTKGETSTAINLYKEAIGQDSTIVDIYVRLGELVPGEEGNWFREKSAYLQSQSNQ